jgi:hypothetical protein
MSPTSQYKAWSEQTLGSAGFVCIIGLQKHDLVLCAVPEQPGGARLLSGPESVVHLKQDMNTCWAEVSVTGHQ